MEDVICSCGCGYQVNSKDFIRFHVESEQEQAQREACEQFEAEQEVMREQWEEEQNDHSAGSCFCTRHWG